MFNYRVENLVELLAELKKDGVTIVGEMQDTEYGKFGWILDPRPRRLAEEDPGQARCESKCRQWKQAVLDQTPIPHQINRSARRERKPMH
jgi:hypothetical protein